MKAMACLTGLLLTVAGVAVMGAETMTVDGVFGLNLVTDQTVLAVWVPASEGTVVTGVRWFQNDGSTVYPEVLAQAGVLDWPEEVSGAVVLAENVVGGTSAWSELTFVQPITSASEGLYLMFRLPEGSSYDHEGLGGGFGMGYGEGDGVRRCWLTGDGEDWNPMNAGYRMAVEPILAQDKALSGVLVLEPKDGQERRESAPQARPKADLSAFPNPFNPQTEIAFTIPEASWVKLEIYDLRGRMVRNLEVGALEAGEHARIWDGRDESGGHVASGVYFARLEAGVLVISKPLVLLK